MRRINRNASSRHTERRGAVLAEALLALGWGAMIPCLLLLGGAVGF
ncbi:hypothetical protein [Verticiella sediminum]|nr:hypothetical protein [Verticiella sediminum]